MAAHKRTARRFKLFRLSANIPEATLWWQRASGIHRTEAKGRAESCEFPGSVFLLRILFFAEGQKSVKPDPRHIDGIVADRLDVRSAYSAELESRYMQLVPQFRKCRECDVVQWMALRFVQGRASRPKKPLPKKRTRERSAVVLGVVSTSTPPGLSIRWASRRNEK